MPTADNYVRQGVTTIFEGPDGSSPIPLGAFLDKVGALHTAPNFGSFLGQGSVRNSVIGAADREATPDELAEIKDLVRSGMRDGAFGLSSGLIYVPGVFTPHDEVVALAEVAGSMGGMYISHMRDETDRVADSVRDTIDVGERGSHADPDRGTADDPRAGSRPRRDVALKKGALLSQRPSPI